MGMMGSKLLNFHGSSLGKDFWVCHCLFSALRGSDWPKVSPGGFMPKAGIELTITNVLA